MNWEKVKLGEICDSCLGKMLDKVKNKGELRPYLANLNVRWGEFETSNLQKMKFEDHELERYGIKYGDLIMCEGGEIGRCAIWKEELPNMMIQKALHRIRPKDSRLNIFYLLYWFIYQGQIGAIDQYASGTTTIKHLPAIKLKQIEVDLPPRHVQDKIASILSAYDDMIDNCKKQIALLEEAAQRLYREWFVDLRFPGHETTPIGENGYPKDWRETKLDDITSKFATGLNPRKNFVLGNGKNFYVTIKNLTQTYVVLDDKCDKVDDEALAKINRRSDLKAGDVLFSGIGTIGRVALIFDTPTNWNISESLFTLRPNSLVSSEYLYLLLLDSGIQGYAQANSQGSAQKGIRMAALKAYSFMLPSEGILKLFDTVIKPYIDSLNVIHKMLNYYIEARDTLLPRLISGQIEINA